MTDRPNSDIFEEWVDELHRLTKEFFSIVDSYTDAQGDHLTPSQRLELFKAAETYERLLCDWVEKKDQPEDVRQVAEDLQGQARADVMTLLDTLVPPKQTT